ncbi:HNH endonuclease [Niabella aurantiaca]|uniref:HNH endonuclease n=1 Tax=Niabella aurantiaca TaxID=379900 RepID=UPI000379D6D4
MSNILHSHCCYCRRRFSDANPRTRDHFIPKSRTGNDTDNILQCCHECNQWKADKQPDIWLTEVQRLLKHRTRVKNYQIIDYKQIIGSINHWMKFFKGKQICKYKL